MPQTLEKTSLTTGLFLGQAQASVAVSSNMPQSTRQLENQRQLLVMLGPSLEHSGSRRQPLSVALAKYVLQPPQSPQGFLLQDLHISLPPPPPRLPGNVIMVSFAEHIGYWRKQLLLKLPFTCMKDWIELLQNTGSGRKRNQRYFTASSPLSLIFVSRGKGSCLHVASFQINY